MENTGSFGPIEPVIILARESCLSSKKHSISLCNVFVFVFWPFFPQVLALIVFPLCVTYSERGGIYVLNSNKSLNFTVKYPFNYDNTTIVYTDEDAPIDSFKFDSAIQVCVKLFVGVTVITCIAAVAVLLVSCAVHRNEKMGYKVLIAVS